MHWKRGAFSLFAVLFYAVMAGCEPDDGNNGNNGNNDQGGFVDNGLAAPRPLPVDLENVAPEGGPLFPPAEASVAPGDVIFIWEAHDANDTNVDSKLYFSDQPEVFDDPSFTWGFRSAPGEIEHRLIVQFAEPGTRFWGLEITDGVNTIRRPADGAGLPFNIDADATVRLGLDDAILLCPRGTQPARAVTTFAWSLGDRVPVRTQVFVSRAGVVNPFSEPLRVFEVEPPTASTHALAAADALSIGDDLSWGLRIETPDEVLFTFAGQVGVRFVVADNIPPTGELLDPADETLFTDSATTFPLRWSGDPGNCEDELASTVFFERLDGAATPADLFASPINIDAGGAMEVDLVTIGGELGIDGGRWAWGVLADDGTNATELPAGASLMRTFRTFLRDTSPRFLTGPAIDRRACSADPTFDALVFSYDDDNGADTVAVTLFHAAALADVFNDPAATFELGMPASTDELAVFLEPPPSGDCPAFIDEIGFYGVELNDGVNAPVRATVEWTGPPTGACCRNNGSCIEVVADNCAGTFRGAGTTCATTNCPQPIVDCNTNGIADNIDIANGSSDDCNNNGVPDECEDGPILSVDAGTLGTGMINDGEFNGTLQGSICPTTIPNSRVMWTVESTPPGSETFIESPTSLTSLFFVQPAANGDYVFRLTWENFKISDTVTLTLEGAIIIGRSGE
jgi:hypothetical protein